MSQHLDSLTPGRDWLDVEGPAGAVSYRGRGALDVAGRRVEAGRLNLIAGGTGITPMYQLAQVGGCARLHSCGRNRLLHFAAARCCGMLLMMQRAPQPTESIPFL
jgi:ferredoxin-NADP reductase